LQEWQEGMRESNHAVKVDITFRKEPFEIDHFWLGEVIGALNSSVKIDTINIRMFFRDPATHINIQLDWNI
jgi:hypothetical protein